MELRTLLDQAPLRVSWETYGNGPDAFEIELRVLSRSEVQGMARKITRRVPDREPDGKQVWREQADNTKYREFLAEHAIVSWRGLTVGAALRYLQRSPAGIKPEVLAAEMEASPANKAIMLEDARGKCFVDDEDGSGKQHLETITFEDFVWQKVTQLSDDRAVEEVREKNGLPPTREDTSAS